MTEQELHAGVRLMRKQGCGFWEISRRYGISLTRARRIIDPKAAALYREWNGSK